MAKYIEFAQVRQGQDGSTYVKIVEDVNLKKGDTIYKNAPQDKIQKFLEGGHITEEQAEERLAKIPEYILQVLTVKKDD